LMAQTIVRKAMVAARARREGRWAEVAGEDTEFVWILYVGRNGRIEEKRLHRDHRVRRVRREELREERLRLSIVRAHPYKPRVGHPQVR